MGRGKITVLINLGPAEALLPVPHGSVVELRWGDVGWPDQSGNPGRDTRDGTLRLGPDSVAVASDLGWMGFP